MRYLLIAVAMLGFVASESLARSQEELDQLMNQLRRQGNTPQLHAAIDREAAQKDAWKTGLFWYTDLSEALAAAKQQNRPILSLRLLGRLDEEMSCANSRFFRMTLYSDATIARQLRRDFILHWESVRPVPIVTIDYGNGTTAKRTLTGNSVHYLLTPDGKVIDALPGLMDGNTFRRELSEFASLVRRGATEGNVAAYYDDTSKRLKDAPAVIPPAQPADRAMNLAVSKAVVERPVLAATKNPSMSVQADTIKNQTELRPQILAWLKTTPSPELKAFNDKVYADLFHAPMNDPYMGLVLPDESAVFNTPPAMPTAKR